MAIDSFTETIQIQWELFDWNIYNWDIGKRTRYGRHCRQIRDGFRCLIELNFRLLRCRLDTRYGRFFNRLDLRHPLCGPLFNGIDSSSGPINWYTDQIEHAHVCQDYNGCGCPAHEQNMPGYTQKVSDTGGNRGSNITSVVVHLIAAKLVDGTGVPKMPPAKKVESQRDNSKNQLGNGKSDSYRQSAQPRYSPQEMESRKLQHRTPNAGTLPMHVLFRRHCRRRVRPA